MGIVDLIHKDQLYSEAAGSNPAHSNGSFGCLTLTQLYYRRNKVTTQEWIASRPPTEEEVGSIDWCIITSRNGHVTTWSGSQVREGWHNGGPNGAIAWQPMPAPYQPPPPKPEAGELWEHRNGGNVFIVGFGRCGTVVYQWVDSGSLKELSPDTFTWYFTKLP